jgi:hypothetical protein
MDAESVRWNKGLSNSSDSTHSTWKSSVFIIVAGLATFDATDAGFLEIKTGKSVLNSSYQMRLQNYRSLMENTPYTIQTSRPINQFKAWLDFWGVTVEGLK